MKAIVVKCRLIDSNDAKSGRTFPLNPYFGSTSSYLKSNCKVPYRNYADIAQFYQKLVEKPQYLDVESPKRFNKKFEGKEKHLDDWDCDFWM